MKVKVEYIGHVRNIIGSVKEEEVEVKENSSVAELLMLLSEKYGAPFKNAIYEKRGADLKANYILTVNGYLLSQLEGVETKLKNGDRVAVLPIVSGG